MPENKGKSVPSPQFLLTTGIGLREPMRLLPLDGIVAKEALDLLVHVALALDVGVGRRHLRQVKDTRVGVVLAALVGGGVGAVLGTIQMHQSVNGRACTYLRSVRDRIDGTSGVEGQNGDMGRYTYMK